MRPTLEAYVSTCSVLDAFEGSDHCPISCMLTMSADSNSTSSKQKGDEEGLQTQTCERQTQTIKDMEQLGSECRRFTKSGMLTNLMMCQGAMISFGSSLLKPKSPIPRIVLIQAYGEVLGTGGHISKSDSGSEWSVVSKFWV